MCTRHGRDCTLPDDFTDEIESRFPSETRLQDLSDPMAIARFLVDADEIRGVSEGFIGFSETRPRDRVLLVTDSFYDPRVAELIASALREKKAAHVDQIIVEAGEDRKFTEHDEIGVLMLRSSWKGSPRRYEGIHWAEDLAANRDYDLVIMGRGGPANRYNRLFRYENIPWFTLDQLTDPAVTYPRKLHKLINDTTWNSIIT